MFQINPAAAGYKEDRLTAFYEQVQNRLTTLQGVESASFVQYPLLNNMRWSVGFAIPGELEGKPGELQTHRLVVGESFFQTVGIPILRGRGFNAGDTSVTPKTAVVNEAFVRKYLPGEEPLGKTVKIFGVDWQIVGVCRDAKYENIKAESPAAVYNSFRQYNIRYSVAFVLRTALAPLVLATDVRKAVAEVDPGVPIANMTTEDQLLESNISQERMLAILCSSLAGLALLLSCIGVYGLMSYQVGRRKSEIALRLAIGAQPQKIVRSILRDTFVLAATGVLVGLPAVWVAGRLFATQLYDVRPIDPITLGTAIVIMMTIAVVAAWAPARRATKVDPMLALRSE